MKWHDDNREKFDEHCLIAAVSQGFQVEESRLLPLERAGLIRRFTSFKVTEKGERLYEQVAAEIRQAAEEEEVSERKP